MSRGIGEFAPIQEVIPDWAAVLVAVITQLGDGWFLVGLLALLYWTQADSQDNVLLVGALWACGIGLYRGLKYYFGLPRPDEPLLDPELLPWVVRQFYELTAHASGYGFPSGHATSTTIVYVGLATVLQVGSRRLRFLGAGVVVFLVSFSRVALGVHYLVDVVVGALLGILLLLVAFWLLERVPYSKVTKMLGVAILLNGFYVVTSDHHVEAIIMLGVTLGLFGGWQLIQLTRTLVGVERPTEAAPSAAVHLTLAGLAFAPLVAALEVFPILGAEPYPVGGAAGLLMGVVVIVPVARYATRVQRLQAVVSFWIRCLLDGIKELLRPATWRRVGSMVRRFWRRLRP